MRIGIVKPDHGVVGGFEVVMRRVERELVERGHEVEWRIVRVADLPPDPFGLEIPEPVRSAAWEAFRYLGLVEAFRAVDVRPFDLVLSTQPPSFATTHPRHLALFSHHLRLYYDLSDAYVAAGFAEPEPHRIAQQAVHRVDTRFLDDVTYLLAASEVVQDRLRRFNGLGKKVGVYHAGSGVAEEQLARPVGGDFDHPLCVSRHEWPKRTELFVHAMKYLPRVRASSVGSGGRLPFVRELDTRLSAPSTDLDGYGPRDTWLNRGDARGSTDRDSVETNVRFVGHVPEDKLARLYRSALCVVAPAYLEDYGLTAIEAMAFGKPLVVCNDGGGLVHFVEDGVHGFVVEPTGRAIAEAVGRFVEDPGLARKLGANAREHAAEFSWSRAMHEIEEGILQVMA